MELLKLKDKRRKGR